MNEGRTIFSQLISFLPDREFRRCVERYRGDSRLRGLSCWEQFLAMAFAQLTYRESLRDIEASLRAQAAKLYHLGIRGKSRATRWPMPTRRATGVSTRLRRAPDRHRARLVCRANPSAWIWTQTVYALDATTIDLCLSVFPWAPFRSTKAAVKLHTLLDLRGNIPRLSISPTARCTTSTARLALARAGSLLRDGSRLPRLRAAPPSARSGQFLRHARQVEPQGRRRYSHPVDRAPG